MTSDEYTKFVIGALLHDIGKFKQRVRLPEDKGKDHSTIGYEWLMSQYGEGLIAAAARDHHAREKETWESNLSLIIYESDNLAASERKIYDPALDIDQFWHRRVLLLCDFSRIHLSEKGHPNSWVPKYWPLDALGDWIVPQEKSEVETEKAYEMLWEKFSGDFHLLKKKENHYSIDLILHLLEKYTSFIPSITLKIKSAQDAESFKKHPDVSLFDHSKITAASAGSFHQYLRATFSEHWSKRILKEEITMGWEDASYQPFLLIGGDLSGVQRFIYTISSKGALKSLKGRSFFLELLAEHIVDCLVEAMGLTRCNVLFTGGGHFYILGPNTIEAVKSISIVREGINRYLFQSFNGALYQCIEWISMSKRHFRNATEVWAGLSEKLDQAKKRKWQDELDHLLAGPSMPHLSCLTESCEVCGREDDSVYDGEVKMCSSCKEQFEFGSELQKINRKVNLSEGMGLGIKVWAKKPQNAEGILAIGDGDLRRYYVPMSFDKECTSVGDGLMFYRINDWHFEHYDGKYDRPMLAGIYHFKDFEDLESLVEDNFGWNRAAVLRMDVDRLGQMFGSGLSLEDRSFSRMASLSRQFSLFFKYHLNGILDFTRTGRYKTFPRKNVAGREKHRGGRQLSVVYSGGDDLFLIGHWLDCLEAAFDIHEAFNQYTGNPELTLSGGYALGDSHYPVYRFASDSGKAEHAAKGNGRDSLCFLEFPFKWREAEEIVKFLESEMMPLLQTTPTCVQLPEGSFSKGFLYRLLALIHAFEKEQAWILPKVAYLAGRNGPQMNWLKGKLTASEAWIRLKDELFRMPEPTRLKKLEASILWTLMMMRKGGNQ
ncbi:MAG: type III-A CRISPR-associated protein Cas10/Csm1 [Deltaproteobacteria bacterium CG03_land_8_20_14_0_80_45_14]|nr:MAG: type III-A CRISPR-associated protein Cas10/Csm1 [Deltaproteobacteria bacterium CG03_land_8_20_14_0_80_45_14]